VLYIQNIIIHQKIPFVVFLRELQLLRTTSSFSCACTSNLSHELLLSSGGKPPSPRDHAILMKVVVSKVMFMVGMVHTASKCMLFN
jgi:hypothetical protein